MKHFIIFGIMIVFVFVIGITSTADAHPHATVDLMESHSHDMHNENFQENFLVHTFEDVVFHVVEFFSHFLSR